jgi:hypothetical protein
MKINCSVLCSSQGHLRLGTRDLDHPISCRCIKHRQLVPQEGGLAACFSSRHSDGSIIHVYPPLLPTMSSCSVSTSPKMRPHASKTSSSSMTTPTTSTPHRSGGDSDAIVMGMSHSGSPSLHTILEESPSKDNSDSSDILQAQCC